MCSKRTITAERGAEMFQSNAAWSHVIAPPALRSAPLTPRPHPVTYTSPSLCLLPLFTLSPLLRTYGMFISTPHLLCQFLHPSPPLCGFFSPPIPLSLPLSLPRCAKWKLSQRPEVAIVTCHSNHSPSCVSLSHHRGLRASAGPALKLSKWGVASVEPAE